MRTLSSTPSQHEDRRNPELVLAAGGVSALTLGIVVAFSSRIYLFTGGARGLAELTRRRLI